jgi:hypothetical protein
LEALQNAQSTADQTWEALQQQEMNANDADLP